MTQYFWQYSAYIRARSDSPLVQKAKRKTEMRGKSQWISQIFFFYKCFHSKIKVMLPVGFFCIFFYVFIYLLIYLKGISRPNLTTHIFFFLCVLNTFYKWSKIASLQVRRNSIVQTNLDRQSEWVIYFLLPTITIQLHYQRCYFFRSCIKNPPKGASEWLWCFWAPLIF